MTHTNESHTEMNIRSDEARVDASYAYGVTPSDMLTQRMHELGMTQTQLASRTGLSRKTINELVHGKQSFTHDTALLLEPVLGYSARFWMDMQHGYDAQKAINKRRVAEARADEWPRMFSQAARRAMHLSDEDVSYDVVPQLQRFFGVASYDAYTQTYMQVLQGANFRRHRHDVNLHDVAVWLRLGQRHAETCQLAPFNEARLRHALADCRRWTFHTPSVFWHPLVQSFAACGVALVYTPPIPGTALSGATYMHADKRVIQVSGRGRTNDRFWFTVFHEIGHVLLHGVKPVFAEWDVHHDAHMDDQHEHDANEFAATQLIPPALMHALLAKPHIATRDIIHVAEQAQVHPGIVAGRVQHAQQTYAKYRRLLLRYTWDVN